MKKKTHDDASPPGATPLTPEDTKRLKQCEEAIETGKPSVERVLDGVNKISDRWAYISIGEGLFTIYQNALYRNVYNSFEQYCKKRWGMPLLNAQRFILLFQTVLIALGEPKVRGYWKNPARQ
jgi:hypothetical protein